MQLCLSGSELDSKRHLYERKRAKALTFAANLKERLVFHSYFRVFT